MTSCTPTSQTASGDEDDADGAECDNEKDDQGEHSGSGHHSGGGDSEESGGD